MPLSAASAPDIAQRTTSIVRVDEKSGHLVRSVAIQPHVVTPIPVEALAADRPLPPPPAPAVDTPDLIAMIDQIAAEQGVEDSLVHSVIRAESNYNPLAVSPKGALGIMQLIPSTARRFGVQNAFDPRDNVTGGVKYLKFLLDYYHDDYVRAVAAYNAGESAVDKFNGIPPYGETRNYVYSVARNLKAAREQRAARNPAANPGGFASASERNPAAETYKRIETSVGSDGRIYYRTP
jgi:soluble lytic murein transglycosylase-like protein